MKSAYTEEEKNKLLSLYEELGTENLELIAEKLDRPVKSIRSKLVREQVYVATKPGYIKKTGKSKKELLRDLEGIIDIDVTGFLGANKESLLSLIEFLKKDDDT